MLGTTIDTAIGIVFIFMLFSLFLSTGLEAIASVLALRARALEITIAQLLESPDKLMRFAHWPAKGGFGLLDALFQRKLPEGLVADAVDPQNAEKVEAATEDDCEIMASEPLSFATIYNHPMVSALGGQRPAYVPTAGFAAALISTLLARGAGPATGIEHAIATLPRGRLRVAMITAFRDANGDLAVFRTKVEAWYDNAMDRLSGEYKRFSQAITFALAFALAAVFNLNGIAIAERIAIDAPLRSALVTAATQSADNQPAPAATPVPGQSPVASDVVRIKAITAAVAAAQKELNTTLGLFPAADQANGSFFVNDPRKWLTEVLPGLLVTALAGMLGAPFWFDLLQKLVNLRGAGPKPIPGKKQEAS